MRVHWIVCALSSVLLSTGCDEKKSQGGGDSSGITDPATPSSPSGKAQADSGESDKAHPPTAKGDGDKNDSEPGKSDADCLAGKWRYDYADEALETMLANLKGAEVTKEEGSFVCTIDGGKKGSMKCSTQGGKPVINEITANQAGLPFKVSIELSGSTQMEYIVTEDSKLQVTSTDASQLKLKTEASVAGNKIPFKGQDFIAAFQGQPGVPMSFVCSRDRLKLLQHVEGMETSWQSLKRVK